MYFEGLLDNIFEVISRKLKNRQVYDRTHIIFKEVGLLSEKRKNALPLKISFFPLFL